MERAFARYRFMSFVTGTTLLILCCTLILHYVDLAVWKDMYVFVRCGRRARHGALPIYLVMSFNLAMKARLHIGYLVMMLLSGFVRGWPSTPNTA